MTYFPPLYSDDVEFLLKRQKPDWQWTYSFPARLGQRRKVEAKIYEVDNRLHIDLVEIKTIFAYYQKIYFNTLTIASSLK
jgi:hypothetical protein